MQKQCDTCFDWKDLSEFRLEIDKKNGKSWRSDTCKDCENGDNEYNLIKQEEQKND